MATQERTIFTEETLLITAGGTREPIDPVRFLGNRSSGKMGYALAEAAVARGARVILVYSAHRADAACRLRGDRCDHRGSRCVRP